MKHIVTLSFTLFVAFTTKGQNIYDFITTYGYENYVENPQKLLAQNKIIKETIYNFKSLQSNSDSVEAEQFFYDEGGNGLKILRVRFGDSSRYAYNSSNLLNDVTTWSCCRNIGAKQVTRYNYDKRSGDYSKIWYDMNEPEKVTSEITYQVNKKELTLTKSSYSFYSKYSGDKGEKKLSEVEVFKYNKDWYLTGMERTYAGKVDKKYTFTLDKNNNYLQGEMLSLIYDTDKTEYIFDSQNRVVKMISSYNNKPSVREFLYNADGTIFQETLTRKEGVSVRKHYYTKR